MSEKVKLTQEQAYAIERIKGDDNGGVTRGNIRTQLDSKWMRYPYKGLNKLDVKQFLDALYIGYEVEETFEVGDWVVHENEKLFGQVTRFYEDELEVIRQGDGYIWSKKYVRHATPEEITEEKQRRWWAKHGREVWGLKEGDIIIGEYDGYHTVWEFFNGSKEYEIYSHEKRTFETVPNAVIKDYKVVCFAEDRKDITHD